MVTIDPKLISLARMHSYLQSTVIPRPIAFASTVDEQGCPNLSPFSFYNTFGSHPPTLVFSPSRRVRDNTTKHTLHNVLAVPEVVVHVVSYPMVEQASLASCEYPQGVNEFIKAGFTEVPSLKVRPPRIAEAPIAMECFVRQVVELGKEGGAGNLVVCEVILMHIKDEVLDIDGTKKRTFQPNNRRRKKTHGFLVRMSSPGGQKVIKNRRTKGRKRLSA